MTKDQPSAGSQKVSSATPYTVQGAWTTALEGAACQAAGLVEADTWAKPAANWAGLSVPEEVGAASAGVPVVPEDAPAGADGLEPP